MIIRLGVPALLILSISLSALSAGREMSPSELNRAGMLSLKSGDNKSASEYFLRAVAGDPSNKYYCNNMGASLMRMGDYAAAEKFLFRAIQIDRSYARALSNMAVTLFHLGRYSEAYSYYILSKNADREYTERKFEKGRVRAAVEKISSRRPEDSALKKALELLGDERSE